MFRHIRWRLLATYVIVVLAALLFLGVHLTRQFEAAFSFQAQGNPVVEAQIRHMRWVVAWAVVVALAIAAGVGLLLARSIAGPVQEMQRAAGDLAAGRLDRRVPVRTRDELGDLAHSLNYMAGELERIDTMRRAFVADASHELRTPVANLLVAVEALKTQIDRDPNQAKAVVADLEREAQRLRDLVEQLLDLSLVESDHVRLRLEPFSPGDVIERAVRPFQPRAAQAGVALDVEIPSRLPRVKGDSERTVQVLTNVLDNALKFTPRGGRVTVRAWEHHGAVRIAVADTGPGIPAHDVPHIFDRFYKADKARRGRAGTGLGLAIAKRLVEAQGGTITVESREGAGTQVVVALPREE